MWLKATRWSFDLDGSSQKYEGTITAIDPSIDEALRTLKVKGYGSQRQR